MVRSAIPSKPASGKCRRSPVEDQMLVDLVGDDQEVGRDRDLGDRRQFGRTQHGAGRIVRRVQHQRPGARCDRTPQRVDVEREAAAVGHQRHHDPLGAGHRHHRRVGVVERLDQDHLGAGLDQTEHGRGDRLGGADGDQHLGRRVVGDVVLPLALSGDRLPQRRNADARRVLVDAVGDGVLGGLEHGRRAVLVGESLAQVHRADARRQRRHLGEHRGCIRLQSRHRHGGRA